jgi:hypothetical protein
MGPIIFLSFSTQNAEGILDKCIFKCVDNASLPQRRQSTWTPNHLHIVTRFQWGGKDQRQLGVDQASEPAVK